MDTNVNGNIQLPFKNRQTCNSLGRRRFSALTPFVVRTSKAKISSRHFLQQPFPFLKNEDFQLFFLSRNVETSVQRTQSGTQAARGKTKFARFEKVKNFHTTLRRFPGSTSAAAGRGTLVNRDLPEAFLGVLIEPIMPDFAALPGCLMCVSRSQRLAESCLVTSALRDRFIKSWLVETSGW